jgi:hypothetical protein
MAGGIRQRMAKLIERYAKQVVAALSCFGI